MSNQFSFLPWVQNTLTRRSTTRTGHTRPVVPVEVTLAVSGGGSATDTAALEVELYGPGDVVGLVPEAVLKTTPPAGEQQYSPLLMASIEFIEEDLPWRYSPQPADQDANHLAPWCFLLVLAEDEFTTMPQGSAPLPIIAVDSLTRFPNEAERWLWAHVQANQAVSATGTQAFLDGALQQNPDLAFSRILSPRRLVPNTAYTAFLVPAYEAGRLAGLGRAVENTPADECAWSASATKPDPTQFPVYYQWEFRTGEEGDFEALARRLQPFSPLPDFGSRPMAVTTPLGSLGAPPAVQRVLPLPGVLQSATAVPTTPPLAVTQDVYAELRPALTAQLSASGRPVVAPPVYGRTYASTLQLHDPATTTPVNTSGSWLEQVNLDPGLRAIAGLGSQLVQDQQEEYMQRAWDQVSDIIAANMNLRGMQSGLQTTTGLRQQHLPVTGAAGGAFRAATSTEAAADGEITAARSTGNTTTASTQTDLGLENYGLHLTGLALVRIRDTQTGLTLRETIRQSRVPLAAFSPAFRRVLKPFGRYQTAMAGPPLRPTQPAQTSTTTLLETGTSLPQRDALLQLLVDEKITAARPKEGMVRAYQFDDASMDTVLGTAGSVTSFFSLVNGTYTVTPLSAESGLPSKQFQAAYTRFSTVRFKSTDPIKPKLDLDRLKQAVIAGTRPEPVYLARANRALRLVPHYGAYASNTGVLAAGTAARGAASGDAAPQLTQVQPVMAYPIFKDPMGEILRQRHPELFLPILSDYPANRVTLLTYNRQFLEAYMLGLNHALGSELLWREYPTDLRGTYFRQFWDVSEYLNASGNEVKTLAELAQEEEAHRDIKPIPDWGMLGNNKPDSAPDAPLLLTIRADLMRRFPNTVVCAAPAITQSITDADGNSQTVLVPDLSNETVIKYPVHRISLGQDILMLSFDLELGLATGNPTGNGYFFVLHERPGEPQFGLDSEEPPANGFPLLDHWEDLTWERMRAQPGDNMQLPQFGLQIQSPGPNDPPQVTNSAQWAYAAFQQPFLVAMHARELV